MTSLLPHILQSNPVWDGILWWPACGPRAPCWTLLISNTKLVYYCGCLHVNFDPCYVSYPKMTVTLKLSSWSRGRGESDNERQQFFPHVCPNAQWLLDRAVTSSLHFYVYFCYFSFSVVACCRLISSSSSSSEGAGS